jgi:histidinol-phosphate aminotransferase
MIRPRKAVEQLKKYRPPMEGRAGKLRLDFNENTVGCAPEVVRALRRALTREMLTRYPEYGKSRQTLAGYFGFKPEEMLLTNGTDDAIKAICDAFVDPGDVLLVPAPTFPVYEFFHKVAGGAVARVRYDERFQLPVESVVAAINKKTRWVALASPNNPTGTEISKPDLRTILEAAPHTLVLVDEAYFDYCGHTVLPWIRKYENLLVTRTFSKAFGLAALRMGFIFGNPALVELMHRAQNPFQVNSLALLAASIAIQHEGPVKRYVEQVCANRARVCRWLESRGIPYVPSAANFILTRVGEHAPEIAQRLRAEGILVRDWSYDPHLQGYLRFTIGSRIQTRRLLEGLERQERLIKTRNGRKAWRNLLAGSQTGWFT